MPPSSLITVAGRRSIFHPPHILSTSPIHSRASYTLAPLPVLAMFSAIAFTALAALLNAHSAHAYCTRYCYNNYGGRESRGGGGAASLLPAALLLTLRLLLRPERSFDWRTHRHRRVHRRRRLPHLYDSRHVAPPVSLTPLPRAG